MPSRRTRCFSYCGRLGLLEEQFRKSDLSPPHLVARMERQAQVGRRKLERQAQVGRPTTALKNKSIKSDMRLDMTRFAERDTEGSRILTYQKFVALMPRKMRRTYSDEQLLSWAAAADFDGDGVISAVDYWKWSLGEAAAIHGSEEMKAQFEKCDSDGSGVLDALEV